MWKNNDYMPEGMSANENNEWTATPAALECAMELGMILEALAVSCDSELNLTVDLGGMQGIIPRDEAVLESNGQPFKDIAILSRVGKLVSFKVIGFDRDDDGNDRAILSRRAAQYECRKQFLSKLTPGDVIPARVMSFAHYGAFVDVGCGILSMLPISAISVSRISHPSDRLDIGMPLRVVVKGFDPVTSRLSITHKELLGTWEENAARFRVGQTVVGIVRSVEQYGAFIELAPNLSGLCENTPNLRAGQMVSVYIKGIIPERMKVKLVVIDNHLSASELRPNRFDYYVRPEQTHIDFWRYSPAASPRLIQSVFGEEASILCA